MTEDTFPRERLSATLHRVPAYGRLALGLVMDPRLAKKRRAAVIAAAGYLVSPLDLVPGIIPIVGQLDDIAIAMAALRFALAGLDPARRAEHLAAVGLADSDLSEDMATLGAVSAWSVRAGIRTGRRAATRGGAMAVSGARAAATPASAAASATAGAAGAVGNAASAGLANVTPRLRDAAAPIARRASDATPQAAKDAGARVGPAARAVGAKVSPMARAAGLRMAPAARAAGAKVSPAAKQMTERLSPAARGAATRLGAAARATAAHGARMAGRTPDRDPAGSVDAPDIVVSRPTRPRLPAPSGPPEPPDPPTFD